MKIELKHDGGFIARFYITWKEGEADKGWPTNGKSLTSPFSTTFDVPEGAEEIQIKVTEKTGLKWEPWKTVIESDIEGSAEIVSVAIYGTILNPKGKISYK